MARSLTDNIRFLLNALALSLTIMAVLFTVEPYLQKYKTPDPKDADIDAYLQRIMPIHADEAKVLLESGDGKPVMLVLYASWCPYCRMMMPDIATMISQHELDAVKPVFIALDNTPEKLARYLVRQGCQSVFTPYLMVSDDVGGLKEVLKAADSGYDGHIPYVGFFDVNGKKLFDIKGAASKQALRDAIAGLR